MNRTTLRGSVLKRLLGASLLALASVTAAQAGTITFEGATGQALNQTTTLHEVGFMITFVDPGAAAPPGSVAIGRFINGSDPLACGTSTCPSNNPTTYLDLFNTGFVDILPSAGQTFSFSALDASLIGMAGVQYPDFPAAIQVLGFRPDGGTDQIQFNIPNTIGFQTFNAADVENGLAFSQEQFTEIAIYGLSCTAAGECSGLDNSPGELGLDNIQLVSAVPEPASYALLALGLLALGIRTRLRR